MPSLWPCLLVLPPAVLLAREDFRTRRISVVWLAALAVACLFAGIRESGFDAVLLRALLNGALVGLLLGALALWQAWRHPEARNLFAHALGAGDAWTLLAVAPLFDTVSFVRFLLAACLAALAWWIVKRPATLPLAGMLLLTLTVHVFCKTCGLWS